MAGPITWRNVDSPGLGVPGQSLLGAQQSINGAFDAFQNVLATRQQIDAANTSAIQTNNRQAFLEAIRGTKSPEELAALQASGRLDELRAGLNATSRATVMGAEDAQLASIRQNTLANQEYGASQAALRNAPKIDAIMTLANSGNIQGAIAALDPLDVPGKAGILAKINEIGQNKVSQGRETLKFNNQQTVDKLKVNELTRTADEALQLRGLNAEVANLAAARLGAPPPDLKAAIREAIRTGKPVADLAPPSDTAAADAAFESLTKSGKYSPELLAAQRDNIRSRFATNDLNPLVGKDAAARDEAAARTQVAYEEASRSTWYAPGSPDARKNYEELAKDPYALFNNTGMGTGLNAKEDVADVQALLHRLATKGLKTEDGTYVTPSVNDVTAAIRQAEGSWLTDKSRADNIEKILKDQAKGSLFKQQLRTGEDITRYQLEQRVKEVLRGK